MKIYGLKNCDTCRKAARALPGAELVDIRETPMQPALRARALEQFGTALINTRSTTWRGMSETAKEGDPASLLSTHAALMKRPLIEDDSGRLHLGWGKEVQAALGL